MLIMTTCVRMSIVPALPEDDSTQEHPFVGSISELDDQSRAVDQLEKLLGFSRYAPRRTLLLGHRDLFSGLRQRAEEAGVFVFVVRRLSHGQAALPVSAFR